jgi:hypothetical protein
MSNLASLWGVTKKLYVNISLFDVMQVPTYSKYLKDILNNKCPIANIEVIKLTEECNVVILSTVTEKM